MLSSSLIPTIYCAFLFSHFSISPVPPVCPHSCLLLFTSPRKELWRSKGVYMLCFFVLSPTGAAAFLLLVLFLPWDLFEREKERRDTLIFVYTV
jgi:hypothetical protein